MIAINKIILYNNNKTKEYSFKKNTIIIGNNDSGKTIFFNIIDYVLGSSNEYVLTSKSIENINFVEIEILKDDSSYFFRRSLNNKSVCSFKLDKKYIECDLNIYKQQINNLLSTNNNYTNIYNTVFKENFSYRIFSFLNKIDAKITSISISLFSSSVEHKYRNRYLMNFIFNYNNIEKIANKIKQIEKLESEFDDIEKNKLYIEFIQIKLKETYDILSIKYRENNLLDEAIIKKINNYYSKTQYNFDDYAYYLAKLNAIDNQLKKYEFINQQLEFINNNHNNTINLLDQFNRIIENSRYKEYTQDILSEIKKFKEKIAINNLLDLKQIVKQLNKQRKDILDKMESINAPFTSKNFIDTAKNLELAKKYIEILSSKTELKNDEIKEKIKELKKEINKLEYSFNDDFLNEFNNDLTKTYINLSNNISCVTDDKKRNNLILEFEHLKNILRFVEKNTNNSDNSLDKIYDPGSDGRYIIIRVITHLCMFKFLNKHFNGLPVFPVLLIDALDHAIDDKSINSFIHDFIKLAMENNIQTISFYKDEHNISINDNIEIINFNKEPSGGFNPWLEK